MSCLGSPVTKRAPCLIRGLGLLPSWKLVGEVLVEEGGDLAEGFPGFGDAVVELILRVGHALEHFELGVDTGLAQFAVYADGVAQQQVAGSGGEDGGRETVHVTVDWLLSFGSIILQSGAQQAQPSGHLGQIHSPVAEYEARPRPRSEVVPAERMYLHVVPQ
jgi:hypothetical protein